MKKKKKEKEDEDGGGYNKWKHKGGTTVRTNDWYLFNSVRRLLTRHTTLHWTISTNTAPGNVSQRFLLKFWNARKFRWSSATLLLTPPAEGMETLWALPEAFGLKVSYKNSERVSCIELQFENLYKKPKPPTSRIETFSIMLFIIIVYKNIEQFQSKIIIIIFLDIVGIILHIEHSVPNDLNMCYIVLARFYL